MLVRPASAVVKETTVVDQTVEVTRLPVELTVTTVLAPDIEDALEQASFYSLGSDSSSSSNSDDGDNSSLESDIELG